MVVLLSYTKQKTSIIKTSTDTLLLFSKDTGTVEHVLVQFTDKSGCNGYVVADPENNVFIVYKETSQNSGDIYLSYTIDHSSVSDNDISVDTLINIITNVTSTQGIPNIDISAQIENSTINSCVSIYSQAAVKDCEINIPEDIEGVVINCYLENFILDNYKYIDIYSATNYKLNQVVLYTGIDKTNNERTLVIQITTDDIFYSFSNTYSELTTLEEYLKLFIEWFDGISATPKKYRSIWDEGAWTKLELVNMINDIGVFKS